MTSTTTRAATKGTKGPRQLSHVGNVSWVHNHKDQLGAVYKLNHPIPEDSPIRQFRCKDDGSVSNDWARGMFFEPRSNTTVLVMILGGRIISAVACQKTGKSAKDEKTGKKVQVATWLRIEVMCSWFGGANLVRFLQRMSSDQHMAVFGHTFSAIKLHSATRAVPFYTKCGFVADPESKKSGPTTTAYPMTWSPPAASRPTRPATVNNNTRIGSRTSDHGSSPRRSADATKSRPTPNNSTLGGAKRALRK
jgi:hypothetical protein